jgi:hypothetical protein
MSRHSFDGMKSLLALCAAAALIGCAQAPKPLYHWEGYQRQVYEFLKGDGSPPGEQLLVMQTQVERARAAGTALPPGFRAHLGMLYFQLGRQDEGRAMLEAEKVAFPESAVYMDFLLKRAQERKPA